MLNNICFRNPAQAAAISEFQAWCQLLITPWTFVILDTVQYLHATLLQSFVFFVSVVMLRKKNLHKCWMFLATWQIWSLSHFDLYLYSIFSEDFPLPVSWRKNPPEWRWALFHCYFQICTNVDSWSLVLKVDVYMILLTAKRHFTLLTLLRWCTLCCAVYCVGVEKHAK